MLAHANVGFLGRGTEGNLREMRGLLCEKEVSSFAKGGNRVKTVSSNKNYFSVFFFDFLGGNGYRVKQSV